MIKFILEHNNIIMAILIVGVITLYIYTKHDWRKNKLNTTPRKFIETKTKKVTKNNTEGISFGETKTGPLNTKKVTQSSANDEGHILAVGGSGIGKTSALLIPTLQNWLKSDGTFLCWDISGDIHPHIHSTDTRVIKYVIGANGTVGYNPFGIIDKAKTDNEKRKYLRQLAEILMPQKDITSDTGDYYHKQGLKMLTAAFIAFYYQGLDFIDICLKVHDLNWHQLLNEIDRTGNEYAIRFINGFADPDLPAQYTASAKQNCEDAVDLFATDEDIQKILHRPSDGHPSWNPAHMEKNNIFIIIDDADLETYQQVNCLIANQCLQFIKKRPLNHTRNILFCMDEAASLGDIDILPPLRKFRKRHCRIFMLTQSLADLDLTWGEQQRKAMMTNFQYKVILECSEPEEQEYWSNLAGKSWMWHQSSRIQHPEGYYTYDDVQQKENNIEPYTLSNLGDQLVLLSSDGAQILDKSFYFKK